jgi:hypothetical protein
MPQGAEFAGRPRRCAHHPNAGRPHEPPNAMRTRMEYFGDVTSKARAAAALAASGDFGELCLSVR